MEREMQKLPLVHLGKNINSEQQLQEKESLVHLLKQHFGYHEFRGKQLEAIEAVLSGISNQGIFKTSALAIKLPILLKLFKSHGQHWQSLERRDCFCLMPTGGGKSMCFQIPALAKVGIVLVISPLIALMENQVSVLKERRIPAEYLSSTQTPSVKEKIYEDLDSGIPTLRLLYVTPELIVTNGFMSKLVKLYARGLLNLIAIDEAHCISTWGHDFRPSYQKLSCLRKHLPNVPMLALTATAVPKVQKDVIDSLCLQHPVVLRASFNRPNIFYEVRYKDLLDNVYVDLCNILKANGDACSIVYCLERTTCDDLSSNLSNAGISCAAYHAGLSNKRRSSVLDEWISSKIQVVIATVAFGMGIDRRDVRLVCHFNIPKSMEAFYQESGRAGRDQLPSRSILYYGLDDHRRMEFILGNARRKKSQSSSSQDSLLKRSLEDFNEMVEYCEGSGCRRKKILVSFGEQIHASICGQSCDACKHPSLTAKNLEELARTPGHGQKNGLFPVLISSSLNSSTECQESEFWNRDGEEIYSDEDISDADDNEEIMNSLARSKYSSKLRLNDKIECLQHAEESYYQKRGNNKQASGLGDKKFISEAMRKLAKERLSGALRQACQRLGNLLINFKTAAAILENDCYRKYGKVGKTFYNSQVASTVRWLSSSNSKQISDRMGTDSVQINDASRPEENIVSVLPTDKSTDHDQGSKEKENGVVQSEAASKSVPARILAKEGVRPPILVDKKGEESQSNLSFKRDTDARANAEKKRRLQ